MADALPYWADHWLMGVCPRCGARLVFVDCYCGGHIVCAVEAKDAFIDG
jgi:hypothetical protein